MTTNFDIEKIGNQIYGERGLSNREIGKNESSSILDCLNENETLVDPYFSFLKSSIIQGQIFVSYDKGMSFNSIGKVHCFIVNAKHAGNFRIDKEF